MVKSTDCKNIFFDVRPKNIAKALTAKTPFLMSDLKIWQKALTAKTPFLMSDLKI
jgi:hypothetical protein